MVVNKDQAFSLIRDNANKARSFGVKRVGIFGSFARGNQRDGSDVDLLVEFEPGKKTYRNFLGFAEFTEELLGRRIELLTPESLSPFIGPRIMKEVKYVQVG